MVLPQFEYTLNLRMPWFNLNSNGTFPFAPTLVHIPCCFIKHSQHRYYPTWPAIDTPHLRIIGAHIVYRQPNPTREFGYLGAICQRVLNAFDWVLFDGHEETRTHLVEGAAAVHESWCGMNKLLLTHLVIRSFDTMDVRHVDRNCNAHEQHLRGLFQLAVQGCE